MPDISMCRNKECDLRLRCYRYRAKPNEFRQAYGTFYPIQGKCNYFWPVKEATTELTPLYKIKAMETQSKQDPAKQQ